jgi:hypothetical protein
MAVHTKKQPKRRLLNLLFGKIGHFFRELPKTISNPYLKEKHYMRGPGPAWHAKHGSLHNHDN